MKKAGFKKAGILITLMILIQVVKGQEKAVPIHSFSVKECIDYAGKNSVQVKNALVDYKLQVQTNRDVTSLALPQVNANGSITNYLQLPTSLLPGDFFGQPGTFVPIKFGTKYNSTASITLDQLLFDGQVFIGLQARQAALDYATKNVEITEENIRLNIYKIYYQLVLSKYQVKLLDSNIARADKLLHDTRALYTNGFAEKLDIDKAQVQLSNLQTELIRTDVQVGNGYLGLKFLMGMPARDSLILTDSLSYAQVKEGLLDEGLYKYEDRRDYQSLQLAEKLNSYNVRRYKLSSLPSLSLQGSYSKNAQRQTMDIFTKEATWFTTSYVTLRMNVPIFAGLSRDAKIKTAQLELDKIQNSIENMKLSIDNDVAQARLNFSSAINTMDFQKRNMDLAESVYDQTKKKYEQGLGSNTEINQTQTDLVQAQTNFISALYLAIIAKIDYIKAIGKL
ncbi:MAG: TolC family protein [Bacteroidetes bacterium]|nr:MAG: TolC family protein [Bacteroidota bacterium]